MSILVVLTLSVGVAYAYHDTFLGEDCDVISNDLRHKTCSDIQDLYSIILQQQEELDIVANTLNNINVTINELTLLHYPDIVGDMVFTVTTDKESYVGDEIMIVSGTLPDYGSSSVGIKLINPSNMLVSLGSAISDGNGNYSTTITLGSSPIYESGTYTLEGNYKGEMVEITFEYTAEEVIGELTIGIDKESYVEDEIMIVSGTVPEYDISSIVLTVIVPSGGVSTIGYLQPDENYNYFIDVELNSNLMDESGNYTLQATYYDETVETIFEYDIPQVEEPVEEPEIHEITATTDKESYMLNEIMVINGTVTSTIEDITSNKITIIIIDPDANVVTIGQFDVEEDGSFTRTLITGGLLWDQFGTYTILFVYDSERVEITFELI